MAERVPFFTLFESFQAPRQLRLLLHDACIISGALDMAGRTLEVQVESSETLPQAAQDALQQMLAQQYDLRQVLLHFCGTGEQKGDNGVIWGKTITGKLTPIGELNIKQGGAIVEGRVFKAECYETRRKGMWTLNFNITDEHGSVAVRKAMDEKEAKVLGGAINDGMWLRLQGKVELTYDGKDILLRPVNIMKISHTARQDNAPEKRVELHLHTQMSSMDALTDVGKVVKQAAAWGHPAIAITDHGTVQAFPKARDAGKGKIKILYGVEGYYVNNLDDRIAVHGAQDQDFDDEIVCFDIETTGLKVQREAITEIGAVVLEDHGYVSDLRVPRPSADAGDHRPDGHYGCHAGGRAAAGGSTGGVFEIRGRATAGGPQCGVRHRVHPSRVPQGGAGIRPHVHRQPDPGAESAAGAAQA